LKKSHRRDTHKRGAFNTLFFDRGLEETLEAIKAHGYDAVAVKR
jgi:sugar phosphate isomerase/epimerase